MSLCELHNASRILYPSRCPQLESFFFILFLWQFIKRNACYIYCVFDIYTTSAVMVDENTILQFCGKHYRVSAADTKKISPAIDGRHLQLKSLIYVEVSYLCRYTDGLQLSVIIKAGSLLARAQLLLFAQLKL